MAAAPAPIPRRPFGEGGGVFEGERVGAVQEDVRACFVRARGCKSSGIVK